MKAASNLREDRSHKTNLIILLRMLYNHALSTEVHNVIDDAQEKNIIDYLRIDDLI